MLDKQTFAVMAFDAKWGAAELAQGSAANSYRGWT